MTEEIDKTQVEQDPTKVQVGETFVHGEETVKGIEKRVVKIVSCLVRNSIYHTNYC